MGSSNPIWASPKRKLCLAKLLCDYLEGDGWQVDLLTGEYYHPLYEGRIEPIIANWKADDRAEAQAMWKAEQKAIHGLSERSRPVRGRFSAIARDVFYSNQPEYYLVGLGFSAVTFKSFAKIRLASSFIALHVDLDTPLQVRKLSKNAKRKAIRYGKPLPQTLQARIDYLCNKAIQDYLG